MTISPTDPVQRAAARIDFVVPPKHADDYAALLRQTDAACQAVLAAEGESGQNRADQNTSLMSTWTSGRGGTCTSRRARRTRFGRGRGVPTLAEQRRARCWEARVSYSKTRCAWRAYRCSLVPTRFRTTSVSRTRARLIVADVDATVVTRVLEAGGHITGKAACEVGDAPYRLTQNFSHGASSSSSPYGPVENPYAVGFSCGGSSSGCGGLISSGAADMGIGGDQGGSIRIVSRSRPR